MLELNIYGADNKTVEKKYEVETADIMYGTVQDIVGLLDIDNLTKPDSKAAQIELGKTVMKLIPMATPVLKDVFPGLTDEELRHTKAREIVKVVIEAARYAVSGLFTGEDDGGN